MHMRHARHPAKEPDLDLVAGRLYLQMFGGAKLGEHGRLLPLDAPTLALEFLAPLACRIRRAVRSLLRLDALRLAAAQVDGPLVINGAALGWLQLGQQGAGLGCQSVQVVAHGLASGVRHPASGVSPSYSFQNSSA